MTTPTRCTVCHHPEPCPKHHEGDGLFLPNVGHARALEPTEPRELAYGAERLEQAGYSEYGAKR